MKTQEAIHLIMWLQAIEPHIFEAASAEQFLIFGIFDYFDSEDCKKAIETLEIGEMELSHRNRVELNIDWKRTVS